MGFVVIAEPDEVNAARIKTILDSLDKDFSYALVGSAEAAIQLVEQNTTDVFIADMQMPVIKGTELFSMIEMMSPETIRIVMTDGARIADTVAFMNECRTFRLSSSRAVWQMTSWLRSVQPFAIRNSWSGLPDRSRSRRRRAA